MIIDEGPFVFGNDCQGKAWDAKIYVLDPGAEIDIKAFCRMLNENEIGSIRFMINYVQC